MRDGSVKKKPKAALWVAMAVCGSEREKLMAAVHRDLTEYWWKHGLEAP
jgi:hypothetical protein